MKRFFYFSFVILVGCHCAVKKDTAQGLQKKEAVKYAVHKEAPQKSYPIFDVFDTIIKKDTIKVVLYNQTMIKCSLNQLYDTFNAEHEGIGWDTQYYSYHNIAPILVPGEKKPENCLLNDSIMIIPICNWRGNTILFLLNRTNKSLKFAKGNGTNPIYEGSYYIYVDLKNNIIIGHGMRSMYDNSNGITVWTPYKISRYRIEYKHFVRTDLDTSSYKELVNADGIEFYKGAMKFYNIVLHHISWERDKYTENSKLNR